MHRFKKSRSCCFHPESGTHSGTLCMSVFPTNLHFFPFLFYSPTTLSKKPPPLCPEIHFSSVSYKWADLLGISTEYGIASYMGLGTIPTIRAERINPVGRKGYKGQAKEPDVSPISTVSRFTRTSVYIAINYILRPKLKLHRVCDYHFSLGETRTSELFLCSMFPGCLWTLWFLQPIFPYSVGFPWCCQVFGCVSMCVFPYVDDSSLMTFRVDTDLLVKQNTISNCLIEMFFSSHFCLYHEFLGCPASDSQQNRQCPVWIPSGMGFNLSQSLVGQPYKFCSSITTVHISGCTDCRWNVLWLDWCLSPTARSLMGW